MTDNTLATFVRLPGVKLERLLPGPITRVWDHLTRPELLPAWFGEQSSIEPRGDQVLLRLDHMPVLERFEKQNAMGWHTFVDILADALTQQPPRPRRDYMLRNAERYGVDMANLQK